MSLALLPFIVLLMGVVDLGRGIYTNNGVAQAAREIARVTSVHQCAGPCSSASWSAETRAVVNTQKNLVPGISDAGVVITCVDIANATKTVAAGASCPAGKFITFFIAMLNPSTGSFSYCNAGHNPPLIVRADGSVEKLGSGGVVLGILPIYTYEQETVELRPGDIAVLYSDGVTEQFACDRDEEFGEDRLGDVIYKHRFEPIEAIIEHACDAVHEFTSGAPAADDFTLVLVRRDA